MIFYGVCVQGWNWVDEGRDGRHKYGYVTEEPDHDIIFVVSSLLLCMHRTGLPLLHHFYTTFTPGLSLLHHFYTSFTPP